MSGEKPVHKGSWWATLPGLLTAAAAFVTAVTGLIATARQLGWLDVSRPRTAAVQQRSHVERTRDTGPALSTGSVSGPQAPIAQQATSSGRFNLLAEANGGQLVLAPGDEWKAVADGDETGSQLSYGVGKEAVFAFRDGRRATFDTFTMLIENASMANVKEFELFIGDESPMGKFRSIGKFKPQNVKLFQTPYQQFRFSPVTARYLKVKIHSCHGAHPWVHEWQLFGALEGI